MERGTNVQGCKRGENSEFVMEKKRNSVIGVVWGGVTENRVFALGKCEFCSHLPNARLVTDGQKKKKGEGNGFST